MKDTTPRSESGHADSLGQRAQEARVRGLRAQMAVFGAREAAHAVTGRYVAAQRVPGREEELRSCLAALHATTRSLEKALADVAR